MQNKASNRPEENRPEENKPEASFQPESESSESAQGLEHQAERELQASELDALAADEPELAGLEAALGSINQLTDLGNQAVQRGLIVGHGYHGSQYEILRKGEIITLEPQAAAEFLQQLIQEGGGA